DLLLVGTIQAAQLLVHGVRLRLYLVLRILEPVVVRLHRIHIEISHLEPTALVPFFPFHMLFHILQLLLLGNKKDDDETECDDAKNGRNMLHLESYDFSAAKCSRWRSCHTVRI